MPERNWDHLNDLPTAPTAEERKQQRRSSILLELELDGSPEARSARLILTTAGWTR